MILFELSKEKKETVKEILKEFLNINQDFLVDLEETKIAVLKIVDENEKANIKKYINLLENNLRKKTENIRIGVSSFTKDIKKINRSLFEAQISIEIGKIFKENDMVMYYDNLGIEQIIYKLPIFICKKFIKEVLKKERIKNLDKDTLFTIDKFFENNLNISETSRKLFIHRNTLIYRLEKIKNLTGLDLKVFKDATKFKLALMIQKYLDFVEKNKMGI